jgi:hypothetical protein
MLARGDQLTWPTVQNVFDAVRAFVHPVLVGDAVQSWDPATWSWSPEPRR